MWSLIPSRSARRAPPIRPSRTLFFCLVSAFLLAALPHLQQWPLWITVAVVAGMIFRSVGEVRRWRLPSSTFCGVLALCLFAAIYFQFGTIFGREAGTAFMAALLTIKFFELRSSRDIALIIFCSFFVVMSSLLYSQDIELFVYCLIMMWALTALLLRTTMGDRPENRLVQLLAMAALIFLQAFPLTVFLFFFFPRYHGVLQLGADETFIGLTDKVEPGSISRLAQDDSTAMTVKFGNAISILTPETLYWRALVLWDYHHDAWTPGNLASIARRPVDGLPRPAEGTPVQPQEITIYPHFHRWLFALDYPVSLAEASDGTAGFSQAFTGGVLQLREGVGINRKERYTVNSSSAVAPQELPPNLKKSALELPTEKDDAIDPRVRALATDLQKGCLTEDDYIRSVLFYFRRQHFIYSDVAGAKGKDALANFLLKNKVGFCEHFSSAFAVLMRLGGIPTRMVVGYHGAQYNPYTSTFIVKQSNAHTWDEVWIAADRNWRRVDPTDVLSQAGASAAADRVGSLSVNVAGRPYTLISGNLLPAWIRRSVLETELRRQEVEADWNDWIFSYDPEVQSRLAQALGFRHQTRTGLGLFSLAAVTLCGAIIAFAMKRRVKVSPVEKFYARFCRGMAQRGAPRAPWEGPLAYTERIAETFPEESEAITKMGRIVAGTRYAPIPPAIDHAGLKSLLLSTTARASAAAPHEN